MIFREPAQAAANIPVIDITSGFSSDLGAG